MKETLYCKMHELNGRKVFACCDSGLIGKELGFRGNSVLVKESFYKGEKAGAGKAREMLLSADSANLVGEEAVGIALEEGLLSRSEVTRLGRVPHAQLYFI